MRILVLQLCLLSLLATPALAGPLPPETVAALDAAIDEAMAAQNLPGVAVGIWIPGRGDYVVARGAANLQTGAARGVDDPFRIGSVTKTMIATVVLQLAEEGRLSVSDPIAKWFPDFPNAETITVDDLLRMRSGIKDSWTEAELTRFYADPLHPPGMEEMIAKAAANGDSFTPPDTETVYTNLNYILLDRIVAAVAGQPTAEVLKARIYDPLGMGASLLPTTPDLPGGLRGYGWNAATGVFEDKTEVDTTPVGGAGAAISSLEDLNTYTRALCTGTLLSPEMQAQRMRAEPFAGARGTASYGEGVVLLGPLCGHNGTIMGFSTEAWYLPAEDAVIVVNVNRLDVDDHSRSADLFGKLARIAFPAAFDQP